MRAVREQALRREAVSIWLAAALLAFGFAPAMAQSLTIDPALLAKANGGDAAAQVAVGEKYAQAAGGSQDRDEATDDWKQAFAWYQKAANKSDIAGEIHLADAYSYGRGVTRDKEKAAEWYRKAADHGDPGAQGTLAMLYTLGQGVPQSDADAYFWFDVAASAETPNRERYIANRQNVGTRITADELDAERERLKKWKAAHPQPARQ
ncbi:MAG TPA: tetratricopeptide repeat protein [Terracidiphilus sp.]|jgi:hypothetical protein|nr:tetratricopeptide repeat protein [Terracidiphilus sp.]